MDSQDSTLKYRLLILSMIVLVLGIYSYPALRTLATTGSRVLPALSAPDLSLYLNISTMKAASNGQFADPYYGTPIEAARMGYLKFRLAFVLFGELRSLLRSDLWWSLFFWNLFWWATLCVIGVWFFYEFLPERSAVVVLAGLAFLMLFNFGVFQSQITAWTHLSLRGFQNIELPCIRPFFPQVPIPLLVLYLGLQIKGLQKRRWSLWVAMLATQFIAFTIFPYVMLMMAGITAVAILGQLLSRSQVQWGALSLYGILCGLADLLFFFHGSQAARSGAPGQYSLIHLDLSVLPHRIGGIWLLLAALTAAAALIKNSAPEIKWPLVGMGVTNLFLLLGDAFFSETALQVSHHGGYFVHVTATILTVYLISAGLDSFGSKTPAYHWALAGIAALLIINGALIGVATYRQFLPANEQQAGLTRMLESDLPQSGDLVIARSLNVDDDCAWVPLISQAHTLFCRNTQVLLSPEQNRDVQRFRQALYLYFTGRDRSWVEHVLSDPAALTELTRLTFLGQVTANAADRAKGIEAVRTELLPFLASAENGDPGVRTFFSRYHRVLVVDNATHPTFDGSRLAKYLKIEKRQTEGDWVLMECESQ